LARGESISRTRSQETSRLIRLNDASRLCKYWR
jgi:hypothetical protein